MQDLVDLHLRVPLEKEIPVSVGPEGPERVRPGQGDEEFPEITEVGLGKCQDRREITNPICKIWARERDFAPFSPSNRWFEGLKI